AVAFGVLTATEIPRPTVAGRGIAGNGVEGTALHTNDRADLDAADTLPDEGVMAAEGRQRPDHGGDEGVLAVDVGLAVVIVEVLPVFEDHTAGRIALGISESLGEGIADGKGDLAG